VEKPDFNEMIQKLKQERDELAVQMHLAKADAKDDWEELEKKWEKVSAHLEEVGKEAADAGKDVGGALDLLGGELKRGYERIRKKL